MDSVAYDHLSDEWRIWFVNLSLTDFKPELFLLLSNGHWSQQINDHWSQQINDHVKWSEHGGPGRRQRWSLHRNEKDDSQK